MIIDKKEIEGLEPVTEGYKVFNNDWTAYGNYCYADENGNVEGVVHKQEGFPYKCRNGLHLCENPLDCFDYYPCVQWNKFAKVRGYGQISINDFDSKVAVEILEIVKVLTFDEFLEEIISYDGDIRTERDIVINSDGIFNSACINDSRGISTSIGIASSHGVHDSRGVDISKGISNSRDISNCFGISHGESMICAYGVNYGYNIRDSYGLNNVHEIDSSFGIVESCGVISSKSVYKGDGIVKSIGVYNCKYIKNCHGICNSILCINTQGNNLLFNKEVTSARIMKIFADIASITSNWFPNFTNVRALQEKEDYPKYISPEDISSVLSIKAYKEMPKELVEYFKSLPEFDPEVFEEITGIEV